MSEVSKTILFSAVALVTVGVTCLPLKMIGQLGLNKARDWWLLGMLGLGTVYLTVRGSPFAPLGTYFLWWWRSRRELPSLLTWSVLALSWEALRSLPDPWWLWIARGWMAVAVVALGWTVWGWWWMGWYQPDKDKEWGGILWGRRRWWHPYRPIHRGAWLGQRTYAGVFFVMLFPFFPGWWALLPALGLYLSSSFTAILALWVALALWGNGGAASMAPFMAMTGLLCAGVILYLVEPDWLNITPRGGSLDPVWDRLHVWRLIPPTFLRWEWLLGYGPRTMERAQARIQVVTGTMLPAPLHCEPLHFLFEYGLPGLAALVILLVQVVPHLRAGDPWSAAWVAGAVCALGGSPFRFVNLGIVWLAISAKLAA